VSEPRASDSGSAQGLRDLRARLEPRGFRPARRWGQNFLVDARLLAAIADEARIEPRETVLEIGPGSGFLTRELLARAARVIAAEIDPLLCDWLRETLGHHTHFDLIEGDALAGKHELAPALVERLPRDARWRVVANLPYSAASPLIVLLGRLPHPPCALSVLVQSEVAERLAAPAGSTARGPLSARVQAEWDVEPGRRLPPGAFWPRPEIDSQVVHLTRRAAGLDPGLREAFDACVDRLFQQRRKTLRALLRGWERLGEPERVLAELGIDPAMRPETLSDEQLTALARRVD
jgi:16S rRNA (adenine1518-N6/adenine1519-N6)-dimethyltransferase